jgi:protein OS-9
MHWQQNRGFIALTVCQYEVVFPNTFITENAASSLLSHPISRSTSSVTPSQETQELSKPGKQTPPTNPDDTPLEETYEAVVLNNQRYLCSIPIIPEEEPQNSTASAEEAKAEEEKELMRASTRGAELLQGMEGSCIYYLSGWWSYSFCYNGEIKQFHQKPPSRNVPIYPPEEDPTVDSYILGRFPEKSKGTNQGKEPPKQLDGEQSGHGSGEEANAKTQQPPKPSTGGSDIARLETRGNARYMVQKLGGGTRCDLLRKDRNIEIQVCIFYLHL